ncbi:MAG: nitronate monooxygenase [Deltaproteobacteria bacterium]|nr:nitronate monooxygenase [Deltaproteobacteria bacterium]MBW1815565.1 nitronate monooxygenase [Deltaproteobacteria bacterium]
MLESPETSTVMVMQSLGNPARALRTPWTEKILEMEGQGASLEELTPMISGQAGAHGWQEGKVDEGIFYCGQVVGRINDVPTVEELIQNVMAEAKEVKQKIDQVF